MYGEIRYTPNIPFGFNSDCMRAPLYASLWYNFFPFFYPCCHVINVYAIRLHLYLRSHCSPVEFWIQLNSCRVEGACCRLIPVRTASSSLCKFPVCFLAFLPKRLLSVTVWQQTRCQRLYFVDTRQREVVRHGVSQKMIIFCATCARRSRRSQHSRHRRISRKPSCSARYMLVSPVKFLSRTVSLTNAKFRAYYAIHSRHHDIKKSDDNLIRLLYFSLRL